MPGHSPIGPLMHEHRLIERILAILSAELEAIEAVHTADPLHLDHISDFILTYADRCHHSKEEQILFASLAEKDLDPELAEIMRQLVEEHAQVREFTHELAALNARYATGDDSALDELTPCGQGLLEIYPAHVEKEERHFFRPALAYFSDEEKAQMLRDYEELERELLHAKYAGLVDELEASSTAGTGASGSRERGVRSQQTEFVGSR